MAIDFPSSPALNDTYTEAGKTWRWNGTGWQLVTTGTVTNADVAADAGIVDTKLATISTAGKVSNSATTATNANTASAIVARDSSGNFSAGTITAALTGAASANVLKAGDTMTGPLSVPLGSASAPSIYPGTDTNTGIYSPGADQVAISTNGTGRLFVNSTGNVGINVTNPTTQLHVVASESTNGIFLEDSSNTFSSPPIRVQGRRSDGNSSLSFGGKLVLEQVQVNAALANNKALGAIIFGGNYNTTPSLCYPASIAAQSDAVWTSENDASTALVFRTGAAGGTTLDSSSTFGAERMRLDSTGRLGIGTASPSERLNVNGNLSLTDNSFTTTGESYYLSLGDKNTFIKNTAGSTCDIGSFNGTVFGRCTGNNASLSTEWGRFDTSGRLLVGTSTATGSSGRINVAVSDATQSVVTTAWRSGSPGGTAITLQKSRSATPGTFSAVSSGDTLGILRFNGDDGAAMIVGAEISAFVDGTPGANDMPGRLVFSTTADGASGPTERMRISQDGSIFTNSTANALTLSSTQTAGTTFNFVIGRHSGTSGTPNSGTVSFQVYNNGNVINTNNSYGAISDAKLKENIVDASSQWNDLKALQVRKYNLKEGQTHTQIGLVAQEVELVSPGLVSETPDRDEDGNDLGTATKSVNYSVLYMKAVKALQEAMERIEVLEQRLTDAGIA
jgi:hypothetical protein